MQCVAQQAGTRTLANYIRCYVVITVMGVSYILKTWHGMFTGKGKQKFLVQLMTVTQLQQSIISFFSANVVLYTEILMTSPCAYLISQIVVLIYVRAHYLQSLTSH